MALKMLKSKAFPTRRNLIEFAFNAGLSRSKAANTVDKLAEGIIKCLATLNEVSAMKGLKESIEKHLGKIMIKQSTQPSYRSNRKKKYD